MKFLASAPSNIALIKYMGKTDASQNKPTNTSISYTLDHLLSYVELEKNDAGEDRWEALQGENYESISLSEKGQTRFLKHLKFLKDKFGYQGNFIVRSANGFPAGCGLASSASSFAALTKCTYQALRELGSAEEISLQELNSLSRQGSGSSCRSFYTPWAAWKEEWAEPVELPYKDLVHQVVVVDGEEKQVSSSEAHRRVTSSELFNGRIERAERRFESLIAAISNEDWSEIFEITWAEFWDMHALFETSRPSFGYMSAGSLQVLGFVRSLWQEEKDGPIVTMDAGPNVHLLYRQDQKEMAVKVNESLRESFKVYDNISGES